MLEINNLHAKVDGKEILKGLNLSIEPGKVHAIMGPNGTGKSTLGNVLSGKDGYIVTQGSVTFKGQDLLQLAVHERSLAGLFLAFQYPVEIPGVTSMNFLKAIVNAKREADGLEPLDAANFLRQTREAARKLGISDAMLKRSVNQGFSGGEKKRFETLQMALLQPCFAIMDETDSGLDIDALKIVSEAVNELRNSERSFLVITHYQRLLNHIKPDVVHIMHGGKIVTSGGPEIVEKLEEQGYEAFGINANSSDEEAA